ncbi:FAD-dependent oxidoreductase [Cryobacterium tepidiphilum]|uniref:FAD-dependent oxidoreductase n=1 Tax=Cryobacterium tepidiphilum TaxID=2486026 RepID=A0A3M8LE76_9MICO|nr:FAD-dependent oxidoreductase [Cryobacterium tepidiphilum]RNE63740.1 FAD-dependent oxidoreductase [Cryobacterium tepidiphilum]
MGQHTETVDTLVIGGGAMGSATAWQLARRGREVVLLERFGAGHVQGASHGASRNFNTAYSDPTYVAMLAESLPLWRELEAESRTRLLDQVGIVNHGPNPDFDAVAAALTGAGLQAAFLGAEAAGERWPGIRFDGRVLHTPDAGRLNADASVTALQTAAAAAGADIRHGIAALRLDVLGDDHVRVATEGGAIHARRVVVTVGAWTAKLLHGLVTLPRLVVTQEQPAHFALRDGSAEAAARAATDWPGFNHAFDPADSAYGYWYAPVYGMYTPGEGVKAGWHGSGPVTDPDARSFTPEPAQLAALQRYVRDWLPGADPDAVEPVSCTYTSTEDEDFVLDRVGPVAVGAGFSGHGFKFVPSVGRILADLATDAGPAPARFALRSTPNPPAGGWLVRH